MILTDAMLWRMIWKEYRAQRGFWLVIAGFAIVLMLLFLWFLEANDPTRFTAPWLIAVSLPAVYALGCSAVVFASEREDGTTEMLQILAARTSRVYLGKAAFSLVSTLAMSVLLLVVAQMLTWGTQFRVPPVELEDIMLRVTATAAMTVQFLAWGFLFSALCRKALTSVFLTALMPLAILVSTASAGFWNHRSVVDIWRWGLSLVVPLLAVSYILVKRTLAGRTLVGQAAGWSLPRINWRRQSAINGLDQLASLKETSPTWQRTLRRLMWLEVRQVLSVGHVLWIVAVFLLVFVPLSRDRGAGMLGVVGIVIVSLFMGVWTFQAEAGRRIRFLADHGLSPQVVWLSKQVVWGLLTVALAIPFVLAIEIGNAHLVRTFAQPSTSAFHEGVPGASAATYAIFLACLSYAAGQFASMLIGRGVTAGFVGYAIFAGAAPWTWLMIKLQVPLSISVVPLVVVLFVTTYAWSRNWLLEQATSRSWLRLALLLGLSIAPVWTGVGAFRVFEVPQPDFVDENAQLREGRGIQITPDEGETAALYRMALAHLKREAGAPERPSVSGQQTGQQTAIHGWEHATESEKRMLADNWESLREALIATARPACAFNDPSRPIQEASESISATLNDMPRLATLILLSARELESTGKLDEALERYVAVLRMARHVASRGTMREWIDGTQLESMVGNWIAVWAAHPDQTTDRIDAGAKRIGQEAALFPSLRDALLTQQFMIRHTLFDDWSLLLPKQPPGDQAPVSTVVAVFDRCFPWERTRGLRVLDLIAAAELQCLQVLEPSLAMPGLDMQYIAKVVNAAPASDNATSPLNDRPYPAVQGFGRGDFFAPQEVAVPQQDRVPWNWVRTTYPLNLSFEQRELQRIWQMRLKRELSLRTMLLRLKLTAFKKAHGEYPDRLDAQDFGMDAIDPYTGTEFGYRREGFPFTFRATNSATGADEIVNARQPVLWSAGPSNVRHFSPMVANNSEIVSAHPPGTPAGAAPVHATHRFADTLALVFPLP